MNLPRIYLDLPKRLAFIKTPFRPYTGFRAKQNVYTLLLLATLIALLGMIYKKEVEVPQLEVRALEMKDYADGFTIMRLAKANEDKQSRLTELERQFQELMRNPITVQQRYFLEHTLFPLTDRYDLPRALVAGQWAIESGRAIHKPGHNYFGLMQWDANRVRSLQYCSSLEVCVKNYASTIKSIHTRKGYAYNPKDDPVTILKKLQEATPRYEGDESDTQHYIKLVSSTDEFKFYKL